MLKRGQRNKFEEKSGHTFLNTPEKQGRKLRKSNIKLLKSLKFAY